jgi:enoyl-CoA hydratase
MAAAGADINEIAALDTEAATQCRYLEDLCNGMTNVKKPLFAAVEGIAVSQGCTRQSVYLVESLTLTSF